MKSDMERFEAEQDAKAHLDEALKLLTGECYRLDMDGTETKMDGMCTIVIDLLRIDHAIGPKGESIFAAIADKIQAAYVEITAARKALP